MVGVMSWFFLDDLSAASSCVCVCVCVLRFALGSLHLQLVGPISVDRNKLIAPPVISSRLAHN